MESVDYKEQLRKQLSYIRKSAEAYDMGDTDEGIRIATSLRVIFHQTSHSTSLLTHMRETNIHLVSTAEAKNAGAGFWAAMTNLRLNPVDEIAEYFPKLDVSNRRMISIKKWWFDETIYFVSPIVATRKSLVLDAVNTDGGAHVDSSLKPDYETISRLGAGWSVKLNPDNGPSKELFFKNAHVAAFRQMAYEVLNSPDIIRLAS